ncbi:MAG: hypothetical protein WCP28_00850 [Actinomycetes bacterium]
MTVPRVLFLANKDIDLLRKCRTPISYEQDARYERAELDEAYGRPVPDWYLADEWPPELKEREMPCSAAQQFAAIDEQARQGAEQ